MSDEHRQQPGPPAPALSGETDAARFRRERDLYRRLLELADCDDLGPLLRDGLELIVETVGADQGYLELIDEGGDPAQPRWSISHRLTSAEVADLRTTISRGIIGETIASAQTLSTDSAFLDSRFKAFESVQRGRIEAVLCAPVGVDPPRGVLYLQRASAGRLFSDEDRRLAETFCRHLAPIADRVGRTQRSGDATAAARQRLRLDGIIGSSAALATVLEQLALVAPLDVSVMLTGDTGTGKSQLARVVHDNGPRAGRPFVEVNCAALPETLIESELFGALPGSHSTATHRMLGRVAAAERGTLFLDEVGDLSLPAQAKLLQLLQSKQYYPLGASRPVTADVRVIAATNVDLKSLVQDRRFREDLFYRLHVLPIRVPSLAERKDDLGELTRFFCAGASERHGLPRLSPSLAALRAVEAAEWPGNVRQLANVVEAAVIRAASAGAEQLESHHLFPDQRTGSGGGAPAAASFQEQTRRFQAALLLETLEAADWNVADAAERLDVARSHVYKLIRAFGLQRR